MRTIYKLFTKRGRLNFPVMAMFTFLSVISLNTYAQYELDQDFGTNGYASVFWEDETNPDGDKCTHPYSLVEQADGKIIVAGNQMYSYQDESDGSVWMGMTYCMARFNTDGTLDNTFGDNGTVTLNAINEQQWAYGMSVILQDDGKIIMGGTYYCDEGVNQDLLLARFNTDGSPDETFGNDGLAIINTPNTLESLTYDLFKLKDGRLIICANAYNLDYSNGHVVIGCFNSDGSVDESFGEEGIYIFNPTDNNAEVSAIAETSDGKIIFSGSQKITDINWEYYACRLNSNGTLDETFGNDGIAKVHTADGNYNLSWGMALQSDDKIVVTGCSIETVNWTTAYAMSRLNADGSVDESFGDKGSVVVFAQEDLYTGDAILIADEDKIFLTGTAIETDDSWNVSVLGFNADGSVNTEFGENGVINNNFGFDDQRGRDIIKSADGSIYVACNHSKSYTPGFLLVKYKGGPIPVGINEDLNTITNSNVYPNPAEDYICIDTETDDVTVEIININGQVIHKEENYSKNDRINVNSFAKGIYFVRTSGNNKITKFVKQ